MRISKFVFAALLSAGSASADPHRIVVLDFDGPKALADASRDAVVKVLAADNDLVNPRRWTEARSKITRRTHGAAWWTKASKQAGVDAVIEGWVQDEGRTKVLTVVVTDASAGKELEQLTIKLGANGALTELNTRDLRKGLDQRFDSITVATTVEIEDPKPKQKIGTEAPVIGPQPLEETKSEPAPKEVALAPLVPEAPQVLWKAPSIPVDNTPAPKFIVDAGVGWRQRSLTIGAESFEGVTQYAGVPDKYLTVNAAFYPFPWKHRADGSANKQASGVGFSLAVDQSIGSTVTFDDGETVGDYSIDQKGWSAAVHYRAPLSNYFTIDSEVGYGQRSYAIGDAPTTFEVPDTAYHYLYAGTRVDVTVIDRASVGFGAKYFHVLDSGDLMSTEWYGPGKTSGIGLDGHFVVPLPAKMFVKGELAWTRFKTSFDGLGVITEEEGVYEAKDSTVSGSVKVGISF